jgi:hypothetical protein
MQAFLVSGFRHLKERPGDGVIFAEIYGAQVENGDWWPFSYLSRLEPRDILGGTPFSPGELWMEAQILKRQWELSREFGWPCEDLARRCRAVLERGVAECLSSGECGRLRPLFVAQSMVLEFDAGDSSLLIRRFREDPSEALQSGEVGLGKEAIYALLWAARLREGEVDALQNAELGQILAWVEGQSPVPETVGKLVPPDLVGWLRSKLKAE